MERHGVYANETVHAAVEALFFHRLKENFVVALSVASVGRAMAGGNRMSVGTRF
jgi:hypothetical protein